MSRYKYDESYEKFMHVDLCSEFTMVKDYLLHNTLHANNEVFDAFDNIYHMLCVKQDEVHKLMQENERLRFETPSGDPLLLLLQKASKSIYKTRSQHNATAAYNVLTRNEINDIDSLMGLSIVDASQFRNAGSNVLAVIAAAQDMQHQKAMDKREGNDNG